MAVTVIQTSNPNAVAALKAANPGAIVQLVTAASRVDNGTYLNNDKNLPLDCVYPFVVVNGLARPLPRQHMLDWVKAHGSAAGWNPSQDDQIIMFRCQAAGLDPLNVDYPYTEAFVQKLDCTATASSQGNYITPVLSQKIPAGWTVNVSGKLVPLATTVVDQSTPMTVENMPVLTASGAGLDVPAQASMNVFSLPVLLLAGGVALLLILDR